MQKNTFNKTYHREVDGVHEHVDFVRGSNVRLWRNDLTRGFDYHWHSAIEIVTPITCEFTIGMQERNYVLNPGEILVIPSGELHEIKPSKGGTRYICLFDMDCVSRIKSFSTILPFFSSPMLLNKDTAPEITEECLQIIEDMAKIYFAEESMWELKMYSKILEFFALIGAKHFDSLIPMPEKQGIKKREYIEKFNSLFTYIDAHYTDDITLDSIAEMTGYSKFYFTRLFKKYANTTFFDYLCYKRIKAAEALLINPSLSITDVAIMSGFPSISTFNRLFKQRKNCTPTEYRELMEENTFKLVLPEDMPDQHE
ncbi:MAG: AraC family transcriptional regulator [Lachnospiraceae bacterium]|nr:AraC family transcriptional regulator [Lachnospiraceae bacterium]